MTYGYSSSSPCCADFLRSNNQWITWVSGCRHSRIRYSKPGSSTIGIGSGEAGATNPTTIFASTGMNGDWAGIAAVTTSTGSPYGRGIKQCYATPLTVVHTTQFESWLKLYEISMTTL